MFEHDTGCEVVFGWHCTGMTVRQLWRQPMFVIYLIGLDASVGAGNFQLALGDMQELYLQAACMGHIP